MLRLKLDFLYLFKYQYQSKDNIGVMFKIK